MEALLVEDDRITQLLLTKVMKQRGYRVTAVTSGEDALALLETQWFPLAFMDLGLPGMSGLALSQKIRELPRGDSIYIIFGTGEEKLKLEAMLAAGADDYIGKPYTLAQIEIRLAVAEKRVREIARRTHLENELIFLARHDPLTRLNNRWQLEPLIENEIRRLAQTTHFSSLLVLDLDQFKSINDRFGHQVGDCLLTAVADALRLSVPPQAELIRFGGDEFVAILPGIAPAESHAVTDQIARKLAEVAIPCGGEIIRPQASMGVTLLRGGVPTQQLIKEADVACYRAKSLGKNRAEVYVEFSQGLLRPPEPSDRVTVALRQNKTDELDLWFQPICHLQTGEILFQEALLRFVGSGGQSPLQAELFLSQINDSAHLRSLDRFVSRKVCQALAEYPHLVASINIHAFSIAEWSFCEQLLTEIDRLHLDGQRLIIEITELQPIQDLALAEGIIAKLAERGIRCAIDDLGSGYSSMHVLRHLPLSLVKIDGRLIRKTGKRGMDDCFLRALRVLADGMKFELIAEHIESPAELNTARQHGISYGQGFYISAPRREPYQPGEIPTHIFEVPKLSFS